MGEISIRNIKKSFGKTEVLSGISLEIPDSSFTIILGPSGCGKSTLLRILCGLETADEGEVWIAGKNRTKEEPRNRQVAMVFQNYALYPHMTAYKNVEYSLKIKKVPKAEREKMVMDALKTVELEDQKDKLPAQMSGGQRQRVALARAIVKNPEVFLMDEPLSNLDAKLRVQMRHTILELHQKLGTTFVYVTHDQTEAMTMGDRIVLLNEGKIVQQGTPREMYTNPCNTFVAGFIGNPPTNIIPTPFGSVGIRPEDFHVSTVYDSDFQLTGEVTVSEPTGSEILYDVSTSIGKLQVKTENPWGSVPKKLLLGIPGDKLLFFDSNGNRIHDVEEEITIFANMCESKCEQEEEAEQEEKVAFSA